MQAPEAMTMSRIFSFSVSAPHDPTLMIDCTSYSSNSSFT